MFNVSTQIQTISETEFWTNLARINISDIETQFDIFETFYWLNSGLLMITFLTFI